MDKAQKVNGGRCSRTCIRGARVFAEALGTTRLTATTETIHVNRCVSGPSSWRFTRMPDLVPTSARAGTTEPLSMNSSPRPPYLSHARQESPEIEPIRLRSAYVGATQISATISNEPNESELLNGLNVALMLSIALFP